MSTNQLGIWNTLEMHCVAAGFKYPDYVELHGNSEISSAILREEGYAILCELFESEFAADHDIVGKDN